MSSPAPGQRGIDRYLVPIFSTTFEEILILVPHERRLSFFWTSPSPSAHGTSPWKKSPPLAVFPTEGLAAICSGQLADQRTLMFSSPRSQGLSYVRHFDLATCSRLRHVPCIVILDVGGPILGLTFPLGLADQHLISTHALYVGFTVLLGLKAALECDFDSVGFISAFYIVLYDLVISPELGLDFSFQIPSPPSDKVLVSCELLGESHIYTLLLFQQLNTKCLPSLSQKFSIPRYQLTLISMRGARHPPKDLFVAGLAAGTPRQYIHGCGANHERGSTRGQEARSTDSLEPDQIKPRDIANE
ncbi:hypothetical protein Hypma_012906 [Hypsizygus marmoreus]|uniref:Uncharacterized protein n=1 Tax=Hypsizygus marmoreus TaxID=39966 RepID=A0A369JDW1_HYPMA|nr:hypothetical protein Hypma_012906 [Hypsizygus marmoreus]